MRSTRFSAAAARKSDKINTGILCANNPAVICQKLNPGEITSNENNAKKQIKIIDRIFGIQYINLLIFWPILLFLSFQFLRPLLQFILLYHFSRRIPACRQAGILPARARRKTQTLLIGCGTWIRTKILAFKGRCPTIRRSRNYITWHNFAKK